MILLTPFRIPKEVAWYAPLDQAENSLALQPVVASGTNGLWSHSVCAESPADNSMRCWCEHRTTALQRDSTGWRNGFLGGLWTEFLPYVIAETPGSEREASECQTSWVCDQPVAVWFPFDRAFIEESQFSTQKVPLSFVACRPTGIHSVWTIPMINHPVWGADRKELMPVWETERSAHTGRMTRSRINAPLRIDEYSQRVTRLIFN